MKIFDALLGAVLLCAAAPLLGQTRDAPPSTPADLVARAYGPVSGGIRWLRANDDRGVVPGYEVSRDGTVLGVFDALSYVDFSLAPGRHYRYGVSAIDNAGQRSDTAFVTLIARAGTPRGIAAPQGLRASIYSRTAAGLAWERAAALGTRHEVYRDGERMAVTDGVTHIDFGLTDARAFLFEVIAIDRTGRRSMPARVSVDTGGRARMPERPPAPTGLRADVYSPTAAEIFWDRSDALGLGHEIRRDGQPIAVSDGASHFDDRLAGGRTYRYEVIAIDRDERRSVPSSVTLRTPEQDIPPSPEGLLAPAIERIARYSATAAELFWNRPPPGSPVVRVELARDGIVLGITDGTSFFDDTRLPGFDHRYTLVAIDAAGNRSDGGRTVDLIRADNVVALVAAVFDAYRGEPWGDRALTLPGFRSPAFPFEDQLLGCDNGGTAAIRFISTGLGVGRGYAFDDCRDGETLFDGDVDNFQQQFFRVVSETGITVTRPSGTIRYAGFVIDARRDQNRHWLVREPVDFLLGSTADGSVYSLRGARISFSYGIGRGGGPVPLIRLSGAFSLASERTARARLQVETPEPLTRPVAFDPVTGPDPVPEDWTFTDGSLAISAPDGSAILLEAGNGDEASARVTVTGSDGGTTRFEQPWNVWLENLRFD